MAIGPLSGLSEWYHRKSGGQLPAILTRYKSQAQWKPLRHSNARAKALLGSGRLYLATGPSFFRMRDRSSQEVQFVQMPYPTATRYLDDPTERFPSLGEKNQALQAGFRKRLQAILVASEYRADLPTVLSAHPLISLVREADELVDALTNEAMLELAWEDHGFRGPLGTIGKTKSVLLHTRMLDAINAVLPMPEAGAMMALIDHSAA